MSDDVRPIVIKRIKKVAAVRPTFRELEEELKNRKGK